MPVVKFEISKIPLASQSNLMYVSKVFFMKMFKNFCILILIHVMSMSTHSMALEHVSDWNVTLPLPNWGSAVPGILDAIGGIDQFRAEVKNAMTKASSMRNGMPVSLVEFKQSRHICNCRQNLLR